MIASRVSFVIPVYNSEATILQTIQSINTPGEILVIDDASTDKTPSILSDLGVSGKIRILRNPANRGAAYSRNLGVRESHGEIIILLDSDVRLEPDTAELVLKVFDQNPGIGLIAPTIRYETQGEFYPEFPEAAQYAGVTACLGIRKSAIEKLNILFDESYAIFFEDTDFFIRMRNYGLKFKFIPEAIAIHRDRLIREDNEKTYYLQIRNCLYALRKLRGIPRFPHELSWKLYAKYLVFGLLNYAWFNDWIQAAPRSTKEKILSKFRGPHISNKPLWPFHILTTIIKSWIWNLTRKPLCPSKK
ncbi:MAG: glycosyltransferase family 2 protein [Candidatus Omnitrophica bacterium]|nr:glycosyltransferase family 2 protein [Candidatus Omnitrophota bacterium]